MKSVLLTGGTGLIGKEALLPLRERGFEVFALKRPNSVPPGGCGEENVRWLDGDLFNPADVARVCEAAHAEYLLHFAWCTRDDYLTSNRNFDYLAASLGLLENFAAQGGRRAVCAGTCFEYAFAEKPLPENAPLDPTTPYAHCKCHLRELCELFAAQNRLEFAWGRIFFVFGRGEHAKRLGGKLVANFRRGEPVFIPPVPLTRDYIYTKDIAGAFAALTDSAVTGGVNIGTGKPVTLRDFALAFARELHAEHLLREDPQMDVSRQPPLIAADNRRLREEVGYSMRYDLESAVRDIVASTY